MKLLEQLQERGIIENISHTELTDILEKEKVTFYCGFDPTAPSLQLGNLFAIVTMRRLQLAGHKPIVLTGGATGMIGDPSGKSVERSFLDPQRLKDNLAGQRAQLGKLLDFDPGKPNCAIMVNNADWLAPYHILDFLREVGRHFRLGEMLARDSVKRRLESDIGMSFTEFAYPLLQSWDFLHLNRNYGVKMQIGGSDQWGNITAGIDLARRVDNAQVYGFVIPLLVDSEGRKFGKSESGALYLDPNMTSPYKMYQFLLNSDDKGVIRYLKCLTFVSSAEIAEISENMDADPASRVAQKRLAQEVVRLVHGQDGLDSAERVTKALFSDNLQSLSETEVEAAFADAPSISISGERLTAGVNIVDLMSEAKMLWKSKSEAKRSLEQRGAYLNNVPLDDINKNVTTADCLTKNALVLRKGKKNYCVVRIEK